MKFRNLLPLRLSNVLNTTSDIGRKVNVTVPPNTEFNVIMMYYKFESKQVVFDVEFTMIEDHEMCDFEGSIFYNMVKEERLFKLIEEPQIH